ncbi:unnamed protein product, partial [Rotaria sp. Silwood1]
VVPITVVFAGAVGGVIGPIVVNFVAVVIDVVPITVVFAGAVDGVIGPVAVNFV